MAVQDSESAFWHRMNTPSLPPDTPPMSSTHPLEILICTTSGKPLLTLRHPPPARQPLSTTTLSAATTAFLHKTHTRIHTIRTKSILIHFVATPSLHITISSTNVSTPVKLLSSLALLSAATLLHHLSASLPPHLIKHPSTDLSTYIPPIQTHLTALLHSILTHPLPYTLLTPPTLPSPISPTTRHSLTTLLQTFLQPHIPQISHILLYTAPPPHPPRLITTVGTTPLSPIDHLLLPLHLPNSPLTQPLPPSRIYLHSQSFIHPTSHSLTPIHLRLPPDHYPIFRVAVGGPDWRPDWNQAGGPTIYLLILGENPILINTLSKSLSAKLQRNSATTHLIIALERPWRIEDIHYPLIQPRPPVVRAVLILAERGRIVGTLGAFHHHIAMLVLRALQQTQSVFQLLVDPDGIVVVWERKFAICFQPRVDVGKVLVAVQGHVVPWLVRFRDSLVPPGDRAVLPPRTPLAGFLAPFSS